MLSKNVWNRILTVLYFVCTININFQDCLRTRQQISQKRRGERRTSDGTGSLERVRGIIKIGCMNKELFWKVESDLILSFWSSRTNMETKAHKKKIKKKMPRRVKKRRKVQTDDGVRNLFKRIQITSIVCRHAIRCLSQNVAWHIDSVFNLLTIFVPNAAVIRYNS